MTEQIDFYFCPMCGDQLKQTIRKGLIVSTKCKCGYSSKTEQVPDTGKLSEINKQNNSNQYWKQII